MKINLNELKKEWFLLEKEKIEENTYNKGKRRYKQFNYRIKTLTKRLAQQVWNPAFVAGYSFYPFIRYNFVERKHKRDKNLGKNIITKKLRPICYAGHKESMILSWYAFLLSKIYDLILEKIGISNEVIGYRSLNGKATYDHAIDVFNFCMSQKNCVVLTYDIKGFFDNLEHKRIKKVWSDILKEVNMANEDNGLPVDHYAVYKNIAPFAYVNTNDLQKALGLKKKDIKKLPRLCSEDEFHSKIQQKGKDSSLIHSIKKIGIPQGAAISAVLSNAYMKDFDIAVSNFTKSHFGIYRRYSDDIIVVIPGVKYTDIDTFITKQIQNVSLNIEPEKTTITYIQKNTNGAYECIDVNTKKRVSIPYLGVEWDGANILLRGKTVARYYRRISKTSYAILKNKKSKSILKKPLYERFTNFGKSNFLSYVKKISQKLGDYPKINKQISNHKSMKFLLKQISKHSQKFKK